MKFTLNANDWGLKTDSFEEGHSVHLTMRGKVDSIEGDEIVIDPAHVGVDINDNDYPEPLLPDGQDKEDVAIRLSTSKEIKLPRAVNLAIGKK